MSDIRTRELRLIQAAAMSYRKHFGCIAVEAAESDALGEAIELLRAAEWESVDVKCTEGYQYEYLTCPICGARKQDGHAPGCRLDALLKRTSQNPAGAEQGRGPGSDPRLLANISIEPRRAARCPEQPGDEE